MSGTADFDRHVEKGSNIAPYNARHPVPTVHGFQDVKEERQANSAETVPAETGAKKSIPEQGNRAKLMNKAKNLLHIDGHSQGEQPDEHQPYGSQNRNIERVKPGEHTDPDSIDQTSAQTSYGESQDRAKTPDHSSLLQDTSEVIDSTLDPKQKRKNMNRRGHALRQVTDPVTHLPIVRTTLITDSAGHSEKAAGALTLMDFYR